MLTRAPYFTLFWAFLDLPPTLGVEAHNYGHYVLWDMAGNPRFCVGKGLFYHNAQIGIVVHGGEDYLNAEEWECL